MLYAFTINYSEQTLCILHLMQYILAPCHLLQSLRNLHLLVKDNPRLKMEIKVVMQHKINTVGIKLLQYYCMTSWLWRLPNSSFASFRCWLWGYSRKVRRACLASCSTSGGVAPAGEGHVYVRLVGWWF